ncbi:MAG: DUF5658 family protein [Candidatus Aminicenantes bacterium]|nr:DUF5658 family protein [Candidatus Aminicenantes bacterium]
MKKGQTKKTLLTIIAAAMAAAFIFTSPMTANELTSFAKPEGRAMIMNMEYVPISEKILIDTAITTSVQTFPTSSKQLTLKPVSLQTISPVSPQIHNFTFEPKRQSQGGFIAAIACTFVLHAADYFTTRHALQYSRLQEGNPFMKKIVSSPLLFAGVKLGVAGLQSLLLKGLFKKNKTLAWVVGTAMNVALSAVVANNLSKINKIRNCMGY